MIETLPDDEEDSASLRRRTIASLAGGALVSGTAVLTADSSASLLLGVCVAGVLFRQSATAASAAARFRTGVLVGLGVGLINALGAILSRGAVEDYALGAEVSAAIGVSAALSWGIAGLILRTQQSVEPRQLDEGAARLARLATAVAGPAAIAITPGSIEGEFPDLPGRSARQWYAVQVLGGAVFNRARRGSETALDWVLKTDVRLYGLALVLVLTGATYSGLQAGRFLEALTTAGQLFPCGGFLVAVGERLRERRNIEPIRFGRDKSSRH